MEIYPHWDTSQPKVPIRSTLYSLTPIGVGTADVESLTSYIARLSQEHCLTPFTLLSEITTALMGDTYRIPKTGIHPQFARGLNGIGSKSQTFTGALELLTSRHDVHYTTLTTYADVVSRQQLIRSKRSWCSACFDEQARRGSSIYEPLLWSVAAVTACLHHQKQLAVLCPRCGGEQAPLSSFMRPGYCAKCRSWLGALPDQQICGNALMTEAEPSGGLWATGMVSQLLTAAPHLSVPPTRGQFIAGLELCINQIAWGSINDFSSRVGIWHVSIRRMLKGDVLPTMSMLLRLSSQLNLPLVALLAGAKEIPIPTSDIGLERLNRQRKEHHSSSGIERLNFTEVERLMLTALDEHPPPSATELQRRTGRKIETLRRRFPELYAQIITRYRNFHRPEQVADEEVEAALITALKQNPPPSLQSLFRLLGCRSTGYRYYVRFPKLCRAVAARYRKHRNKPFDVEDARRSLEASLTEDPAPSFSEAARRLRHKRPFIRIKFPELSAAITARHQSWLCKHREDSKKALMQEVEKAIRDLNAEGLYASVARIQDRLSRHWHAATFKQAIREVKENLGC